MEQVEGRLDLWKTGTKVIVYTLVMRGNAQTSYVGTVLEATETGLVVETVGGKMFFPWSSIERVTF